ncbi:MAG: serine/threonine protein kinase [Alphaproteobacteria bacterium]|nr:serine/threonine protein kinase [Alphaproteobacteria bacterium]
MARYIGDYEVIRELGSGHFGTVYLAVGETPARGRAPAKRRMVAIKKLRDGADERSVDLLLQEFALLEQVKHRGIVRVYEYIEHESAVVMEHIHGVTLRQVLEELSKAREQVFTEAAIEIGCELADALYQAWTTPGDNGEPLQLVHRDLKPANVMLTPQGEVKILDFGLARVDNADFAKDSGERIKGTPIYMAPEQARGESVDHRTDLFALGLILYELLMRDAAYTVPRNSRDPLSEVHRRIESGDLREQCAELESRLPQLGPIVTRLLQRRAEDRYQGGHDVMVDLRRQLYRDRGAYLQEFCEFFFGSICEIGPAPTLDGQGGAGRPRSGATASGPASAPRVSPGGSGNASPGRRLSIEERLKQSMARENTARKRVGRTPEPTGPSAPPPMPSSPAASGRAAPPPPPGPGAPVSSRDHDDSRRRPVRPPVGGTASRAQTFTPSAGNRAGDGRPALRSVGGRSPDETGMLEMVPLSNNADESEAAADPSATAFFAIPAPKADRSRPGGAGGPMPPPPMGGPSSVAPPPGPPPAMGGFGAPPPPPGGGFGAPPPPMPGMANPGFGGAPTPMVPPPQPMVQGPVASYGGQQAPMGAQTPFQVSGPTPGAAPSAEAEQRVQSTRLYAILFALFMLIGVAVVVAVWLRPSGGDGKGGDEVVADAAATAPVVTTTKKKKVSLDEDTGMAPAEPEPKRPPKRSGGGTSGGTSSKPPASTAPPPPAAPSTPPGNITVTISDPSVSTSVEVVCPSNYRNRATFAGGRATLTGVPAESCTMFFKGGITQYRFGPVSGGKSLSCSVSGTAMVCR